MKRKNSALRTKIAGIACSMALVMAGVIGISGGSSVAATNKAVKFTTPFKIAGFYDIPGEDPYTGKDENILYQMAVSYLNAHGGVGGRPVEFKRFATTYDPSTALTGYLQALAWHPSVIIGIDNPDVLVPLENKLAKSPVPVLAQFIDPSLQKLKEPNDLFAVRAPYWVAAGQTTAWMIKHFNAKSVGLICDATDYGTNSCDSDAAAITAAHVTQVARVQSPITSTDESTEAQAMLGSSIVSDEGYPAVIQLDLEGMDAEGLNIPISAGGSLAYTTGGLDASQLSQLYGYADCVPANFTSSLGKYVDRVFLQKFGQPLEGYDAHIWDSVLMAAKAAELAGSPTPSKVAKELRTMKYKGICSTYYSGPYQNMVHAVDVIHPLTASTFQIITPVTLPNS